MINQFFSNFLLFIACCLLLACPSDNMTNIDEDISESTIPNEMVIDSFLWQKPIAENFSSSTEEVFTKHPILHEGKVIWNIPSSAGFVALDRTDGTTIWDNRGITNNNWNAKIPTVEGNHLYYVKSSGLRKMNLNTGEIEVGYLWPNLDEYLGSLISVHDGYLFCTLEQFVNIKPEFTEMIRSPINDLSEDSWEHFGRRTTEDYNGCDPTYYGSVLHTSQEENKYIIVVDNIHCGSLDVFGRISAIDIATDTVVWEIIDEEGVFQDENLIYEDGTVYAYSRHSLYAIDAETGTIDWKTRISRPDINAILSSFNLQPVSFQDLIVIVGHANKIVAFRKSDGTVAWDRTFDQLGSREDREATGSEFGVQNIYNGKLYYRNWGGDIMVLKLLTGEYRRYHLPEFSYFEGVELYQPNFGRHDIIVDDKGIVYASDGFRFLAFQLPIW